MPDYAPWIIAYVVVGILVAEAATKRQFVQTSGKSIGLRAGVYAAVVLGWLPVLAILAAFRSQHTTPPVGDSDGSKKD